MTLLEVANYVCAKVEQTDTDSIAAAKLFASKRMKIIWDAALWPSTLSVYSDTALTGTRYVAPEPFERILEIRRASKLISKFYTPQAVFQSDPSMIDSTSDPVGWMHDLPLAMPFWSDTGFSTISSSTGYILQPDGTQSQNSNLQFRVRFVGSAGTVETEYVIQYGIGPTALGATFNAVRSIGLYNLDGTTPTFNEGDFSDYTTRVWFYVNFNGGQRVFFTKEELSSIEYACVRWLGRIGANETIQVLAKRRFRGLTADANCDLIPSTENAILAFVQSDMLQRDRQYAKAQSLITEAQAALKIAVELVNTQQAQNQRIIPEDIHGVIEDTGGFTGKTYW